MLKKIMPRAAAILVCTAAFTFVAAQFPWETPDPEPSSEPSYESSASDLSESGSSSDDSSPYNLGSYSATDQESEPASQPAAAEKSARPAKEKKAPRQRSDGANLAFAGSQKFCPVCASNKLKENLYAEYNGKKIYVCCAACIGRVKRNPAPFAAKIE